MTTGNSEEELQMAWETISWLDKQVEAYFVISHGMEHIECNVTMIIV